jgi:fatty-acid desaturase
LGGVVAQWTAVGGPNFGCRWHGSASASAARLDENRLNTSVPIPVDWRTLDAADLAKHSPWKQPWWRATPGDGPVLFWVISIHIAAGAGLVLTPLPGWYVFGCTVVLYFLGGLGTTVGFHRAIAHKSVRLHPIVRNLLSLFAMLNGSGSPLSWVAYHRLHHAKADTLDDVSSPRVGGFWWSHLRWLWQAGLPPIQKYCRDIDTPEFRIWSRLQIPLVIVAFCLGAPWGLAAFFWLGPIRLVVALHAQCCVNSVCHLQPGAQAGQSTAKNVGWLSIFHLGQGENWHRNHHDRPGSARIGWGLTQVDLGWLTIWLLGRLGMASEIRCPSGVAPQVEQPSDPESSH